MKINIKETIELTAVLLQLENVLEHSIITGEIDNLTDEVREETEKEINLLVRCTNLVCGEVASEYFPLKATQKFVVEDGSIPFSEFEKPLLDIYSIKQNSELCKFKLYPSEVKTVTGDVEIEYTYIPEKMKIDDDMEFEQYKLGARTIAYGIACEYCLINSMFEEALIWNKRFKDSLYQVVKSMRIQK